MAKMDKSTIEKCARMSVTIYEMCEEENFTKSEMLMMLGCFITATIESNYEPRLWVRKFEEFANETKFILSMDASQQSEDDNEEEEEEDA